MFVLLRLFFTVCLCVVVASGNIFAEEKSPKIEWTTDVPSAAKRAVEQGKPILVRFGAEWCTYCKKMDNYAFDDDEICAKINEHFIPLYVDADLHPGMLAKMQVKSLPSFVVLSPLMNVVDRASGYKKEKEFMAFIDPHCKLHEIAMQRQQNTAPAVEQVQAHRFEIKNLPEFEKGISQTSLQPSATAFAPPKAENPPVDFSTNQIKPPLIGESPAVVSTAQAEPFPSAQSFAPPSYQNHVNNFNPMQRTTPVQPESKVMVDPKATVSTPSLPPPLQLENPGFPEMADIRPNQKNAQLEDAPVWGQPQTRNLQFNRPEPISSIPPVSASKVPKLTDNKSPFALPDFSNAQVKQPAKQATETVSNPCAQQNNDSKTSLDNNEFSPSTPAKSVPGDVLALPVSSGLSNIPENSLGTKSASINERTKPLAFAGVCIVSILERGELIKGDTKYQTSYQGFTLYFSSQKHQDLFLSNPVRYWPMNNGVCPVSAVDKHQALLGEPVFAVRYQERTHFCADREAALSFLKEPKRYNDYVAR